MALAFVHVVGALGASFAFGLLVLFISTWEQERVQKRRFQDASIALGVPVAALENDESLSPSSLNTRRSASVASCSATEFLTCAEFCAPRGGG